ncbi:MAG: DUF3226 domain-containing protein [Planctomycetaceae bacterium]|nr:DUF3226 domain-containing protein [Planctomycetaceae bacterium]
MLAPKERLLVVEGNNDYHAILHVLRETGVLATNLNPQSSPLDIVKAGNKKEVIEDIKSRSKESNRKQIGFVLDADHVTGDPPGCQPSWHSVRHELQRIGVQAPTLLDPLGFIGDLGSGGPRIGVWIMPDNTADGALEEFLFSPVDQQQPLMLHAKASTQAANLQHGANFLPSKQSKAELSCWLAWQEEPAMTYGQAVQAGKFDLSRPGAQRFCDWIRRLFDL